MTLSEAHRQLLLDAAISPEVIDTCGAKTVDGGIAFLHRGPKKDSWQLRPDVPGDGPKYRFAAGEKNFLNIIYMNSPGLLLVIEGTKQALAGASWAPPDFGVVGLAGSTLWHKHDWGFVKNRDVYICFDGDAATNRDVYVQAEKFGKELVDEGASSVRFVQIPVESEDDKRGLDDHLAEIDEEDREREIVKLIRRASTKPADSKPRPKEKKALPSAGIENADLPDSGGREVVAINGDLKTVTDNIINALRARWDGHYLFNYGRALTCLEGPSTLPLEDGQFLRLLAETVMMVVHHPATSRSPERFTPGGRPDTQTVKAVMSSFKDFTELDRVVRAPFVRPDGSICYQAGYDKATRTILIDNPVLSAVSVPDEPTEEERRSALDLIMNDWMSDMPFPSDRDRANALALMITPFVRGLFDLVPMAVINGLQMGVGKNLLVDCIAMLATGSFAVPMPYVMDDDETRKQMTAAFRSGMELFAFDEAHVIQGASLARALTSVTYSDRILGASHFAEFPNTVTWMAMGNNVQVNGDCSRRVYWIDLKPKGANPQDRDASSFRHPDLKGWTQENRARLVSAVLTLVRAWFVAGQPSAPRGSSLGSYEKWDKTVGGIVAHAGIQGFLSEVQEKRSETDFEGAFWLAHIQWLYEVFGTAHFTTAEVRSHAVTDPAGYEAPPGMDDASDKGYSRVLGQKYAQKADRWFGDLRLVKAGMGHRSTIKWAVEKHKKEERREPEGTPTPNMYEGKHTQCVAHMSAHEKCVCGARIEEPAGNPPTPSVPSENVDTSGELVAFDLETCSVDELHRRPDFVRIGAATGTRVTSDMRSLVAHLHRLVDTGKTLTGHNILGFDLTALARHHGTDYEALAAKSFDTLIAAKQLDPPLSKGMPKGYYGLNALAERLGVPMKTDDIKRLAKKHGGFDAIPVDDAEYVSYLEGDVVASQAVAEALWEEAAKDPYIAREHRVMAIMGRMSLNGFRVDEELVWDRHQYGQDRLDVIKERLHSRFGFPVDGAAPQRSSAGKAAFYEALRDAGLGPLWIDENWAKNKDGTLSLAKDVLTEKRDLLAEHKPVAAELCDAILQMNGVRSIYGNCIDWMVDGRVHPRISPEQASGRWSVTDPGLTVVGKRGAKVAERAIYLPEPGHVLVAFDADQVDMRAIAAESQDRGYMGLFIPKGDGSKIDPHSDIAAMVGLSRQDAKVIGHGYNYGMGVEGQVRNGVERSKAEQFAARMRDSFPRLEEWKREVREIGEATGILVNGFGRRMRLNPQSAYTQAPALMGQGGTRDLLAEGLLNLPAEVLPMLRVVVHDEIVLSIPKDIVDDVCRTVVDCMTFEHCGVPITWGVSKYGDSWASCY